MPNEDRKGGALIKAPVAASPTAARSPQQIRAEIQRAREQIASSMMALKEEVQARTDWRGYVRKNPVPFFAGAFALGFLLAFRRR